MVVAGLGCLAGLVALAAWWSMRRVLDAAGTVRLIQSVGVLGSTAVGALGAALILGGPLAAFVLMPAAAAGGIVAALRLPHGDDGCGGDSGDDEPPWWPTFERELQRYRERTRA
jgi:hypothetical protein